MDSKRFRVIYTGKLVPGTDLARATSNLVLDLGIAEAKAKELLSKRREVTVKSYEHHADARKVEAKLTRAGLECRIEERHPVAAEVESSANGESVLMTVFSRFAPFARK
jgi:hypothetical protein